MPDVNFKIDNVNVSGKPGQTIMEAADAAGIYIPRLCAFEGLESSWKLSCLYCTRKWKSSVCMHSANCTWNYSR